MGRSLSLGANYYESPENGAHGKLQIFCDMITFTDIYSMFASIIPRIEYLFDINHIKSLILYYTSSVLYDECSCKEETSYTVSDTPTV